MSESDKNTVNKASNSAIREAADRLDAGRCHCGEPADPKLMIECRACYDAMRAEIRAIREGRR
jgi:hypothetical protein